MKIHSIFESISGEAGIFPQGTWCTFVRVQGCPLRCSYCDTVQAQSFDRLCDDLSTADILARIRTRHVLVTGGEPLAAEGIADLLSALIDKNYIVQVETNGSLPPPDFPGRDEIGWVVDLKGPSSSMTNHMPTATEFDRRWRHCIVTVKFVVDVNNPGDIKYMLTMMQQLGTHCYTFLVSPIDADGGMIPVLVHIIRKEDASLLEEITFSVQLHKLLNLP